jgi:hypothetical protein
LAISFLALHLTQYPSAIKFPRPRALCAGRVEVHSLKKAFRQSNSEKEYAKQVVYQQLITIEAAGTGPKLMEPPAKSFTAGNAHSMIIMPMPDAGRHCPNTAAPIFASSGVASISNFERASGS